MKRNIEKERQVERNKNEQRERGGHSDRKKRRRERRKRMKYLRGAFKRKEKTQPGEGKEIRSSSVPVCGVKKKEVCNAHSEI